MDDLVNYEVVPIEKATYGLRRKIKSNLSRPNGTHRFELSNQKRTLVGYQKGVRLHQWVTGYREDYLDKLQSDGVGLLRLSLGDYHPDRATQEDWESLGYYTEEVSKKAAREYYDPVYPVKSVGTIGELFPWRANEKNSTDPVYDWTKKNKIYFHRIKAVLDEAQQCGMVVWVDFIDPWDVQDPWYQKSPYHPQYNVNYSWRIWREDYPREKEVEAGGPMTDMKLGTAYGIHDRDGAPGWCFTTPDCETAYSEDFGNAGMKAAHETQKLHFTRIHELLEDYKHVVASHVAYMYDENIHDWWAQWSRDEGYTTPLGAHRDRGGQVHLNLKKPALYNVSDLSGVSHNYFKPDDLPSYARSLTEQVWGEEYWHKEAPDDYRSQDSPVTMQSVPSILDGYPQDHRFSVHFSIHKFWIALLSGISWVGYGSDAYGPGEYQTPSGSSVGNSTLSSSMFLNHYDHTRSLLWHDLGDDIFVFRSYDSDAIAVWFHPMEDDFATKYGADYESKTLRFADWFSEAPGWYQDQFGTTYQHPKLRENFWQQTVDMMWLDVDNSKWIKGTRFTLNLNQTVTPPDETGHWVLVCKPV